MDPDSRPPRPKVIYGLEENSLHLVIDNGGGVVTIMDRESYDYLYEESTAPDPSQRDLDSMLPAIDRVRVLASGMFRGQPLGSEILVETTDPVSLEGLKRCLRIVEDPSTFTHCQCLGGPTLELFTGQALAARIASQHGRSVRWNAWKHDARLRNGNLLVDWLKRNGVEAEFLDVLHRNDYEGAMRSIGHQRPGASPLTRGDQQVRLAELKRVRGGDLEEALARCNRALETCSDRAFAYGISGMIRLELEDHVGCVADCGLSIRSGYRNAHVHSARAAALDHLGRKQEAIADCNAALEIDPHHVAALNSRGYIRWQLGDLDQAIADFDQAIRLAPEWWLPYLNRFRVHLIQFNYGAAIADCDRVIEGTRDSRAPSARRYAGMAFQCRGECFRLMGDLERAEADARTALRIEEERRSDTEDPPE